MDDGEEANDVPLIHGDYERHDGGTAMTRRTAGKAKKLGSAGAFVQF